MDYLNKSLLIVFMCWISIDTNAQFINIDDQKTPEQLIKDNLINNSCITIGTASGSGNPETGGPNSFASFNSGISNFPFKNGIVLSTSPSKNAMGPFLIENSLGDDN